MDQSTAMRKNKLSMSMEVKNMAEVAISIRRVILMTIILPSIVITIAAGKKRKNPMSMEKEILKRNMGRKNMDSVDIVIQTIKKDTSIIYTGKLLKCFNSASKTSTSKFLKTTFQNLQLEKSLKKTLKCPLDNMMKKCSHALMMK